MHSSVPCDAWPVRRPTEFSSVEEYVSQREDVELWWPYVAWVLDRHDLDGKRRQVRAANGTHPTFVANDVVIKMFEGFPAWRESHAAERAALAQLGDDTQILAPELLAEGHLYCDGDALWPCLVTGRVSGAVWQAPKLTSDQQYRLAAQLGDQVRRIHALPPRGMASHEHRTFLEVAASVETFTYLPPHLLVEVEDHLTRFGGRDRVMHGARRRGGRAHLTHHGSLVGVIDLGETVVVDRHYEIGKLNFDSFRCNEHLLRVFTNTSEWSVGDENRSAPSASVSPFAAWRRASGNITRLTCSSPRTARSSRTRCAASTNSLTAVRAESLRR